MHIGFTGTQNGMTQAQIEGLKYLLDWGNGYDTWLHHGDCIGADAQAHRIAQARGYRTHIHPPQIEGKRAFCKSPSIIEKPKPYLARNHAIVDASQQLIATPKQHHEAQRSGTWATIRYAMLKDKSITIIYPNGVIWTNKIREAQDKLAGS